MSWLTRMDDSRSLSYSSASKRSIDSDWHRVSSRTGRSGRGTSSSYSSESRSAVLLSDVVFAQIGLGKTPHPIPLDAIEPNQPPSSVQVAPKHVVELKGKYAETFADLKSLCKVKSWYQLLDDTADVPLLTEGSLTRWAMMLTITIPIWWQALVNDKEITQRVAQLLRIVGSMLLGLKVQYLVDLGNMFQGNLPRIDATKDQWNFTFTKRCQKEGVSRELCAVIECCLRNIELDEETLEFLENSREDGASFNFTLEEMVDVIMDTCVETNAGLEYPKLETVVRSWVEEVEAHNVQTDSALPVITDRFDVVNGKFIANVLKFEAKIEPNRASVAPIRHIPAAIHPLELLTSQLVCNSHISDEGVDQIIIAPLNNGLGTLGYACCRGEFAGKESMLIWSPMLEAMIDELRKLGKFFGLIKSKKDPLIYDLKGTNPPAWTEIIPINVLCNIIQRVSLQMFCQAGIGDRPSRVMFWCHNTQVVTTTLPNLPYVGISASGTNLVAKDILFGTYVGCQGMVTNSKALPNGTVDKAKAGMTRRSLTTAYNMDIEACERPGVLTDFTTSTIVATRGRLRWEFTAHQSFVNKCKQLINNDVIERLTLYVKCDLNGSWKTIIGVVSAPGVGCTITHICAQYNYGQLLGMCVVRRTASGINVQASGSCTMFVFPISIGDLEVNFEFSGEVTIKTAAVSSIHQGLSDYIAKKKGMTTALMCFLAQSLHNDHCLSYTQYLMKLAITQDITLRVSGDGNTVKGKFYDMLVKNETNSDSNIDKWCKDMSGLARELLTSDVIAKYIKFSEVDSINTPWRIACEACNGYISLVYGAERKRVCCKRRTTNFKQPQKSTSDENVRVLNAADFKKHISIAHKGHK